MLASNGFGTEYIPAPGIIESIYSLPKSIVILSILIAILPFIIYRVKENPQLTSLILNFFILKSYITKYLDSRNIDNETKEEFQRLDDKGKNLKILRSSMETIIPLVFILLILNKSVFFGIVTTQSMVPTIFPKELVLIESLTGDIKKGDIIAFNKPGYGEIVIHRVFSVEDGLIRTKGDNADIDPWVLRKKDLLGKAVTIFGKPLAGLKNIGFYFMPIRTPYAATDPSLKAAGNAISILRLYGPIIAVILLFMAMMTPQSRKKKYYGRLV